MYGFSGSTPAMDVQGLVLVVAKYAETLMCVVCCSWEL